MRLLTNVRQVVYDPRARKITHMTALVKDDRHSIPQVQAEGQSAFNTVMT